MQLISQQHTGRDGPRPPAPRPVARGGAHGGHAPHRAGAKDGPGERPRGGSLQRTL